MPMPASMASRGECMRDALAPERRSCPRRGGRCPVSTFDSVDLPAPFSPSSAWTSPARDLEVDGVVGDDTAGEPLRDPAHRDRRGRSCRRSRRTTVMRGRRVAGVSRLRGRRRRPATNQSIGHQVAERHRLALGDPHRAGLVGDRAGELSNVPSTICLALGVDQVLGLLGRPELPNGARSTKPSSMSP